MTYTEAAAAIETSLLQPWQGATTLRWTLGAGLASCHTPYWRDFGM